MEYPFKDLMPLDEVLEREGYYKDWTHLDPEVFYSLTQISNFIKTKGYGVDVRLLIAQLAEHFGLKTTQVVDLANLLQQKFTNLEGVTQSFTNNINSLVAQMEADKDAVIANATVDSEVILARGGKSTLGTRLDDTTAQLEQIAVNPIQYGAVGDGITDDTLAIQTALNDSENGTFMMTKGVGDNYLITTLSIPSNVSIIFGDGVKLKAKTGSQYVLSINNVNNVSIKGNLTELSMDKASYSSEYNHGVLIQTSNNVIIDGLYIKDTGGDGIYVGGGTDKAPCRNVVIKNSITDNARRNGISITHAVYSKVINCIMRNTKGTAPEMGIDVEPNAQSIVNNIEVVDSVAYNNNSHGMGAFLQAEKVNFINCKSFENKGSGFAAEGNSLGADIKFINSEATLNQVNGFALTNVSNSMIDQSSASDNRGYGFAVLGDSQNIRLTNSTSYDNDSIGFYIRDSAGSKRIESITVDNCSSELNTAGFQFTSGKKISVSNCQSFNNSSEGFQFNEVENSSIENCRANNNILGIRSSNSLNLKIVSNSVYENLNGGVLTINNSTGDFIANNFVRNNGVSENSIYKTNIMIHQSKDVTVINNKIRETNVNTTVNTYGINVNASATDVYIKDNDCFKGGYLRGLLLPTSSVGSLNAGNRNKDGTYSTTGN